MSDKGLARNLFGSSPTGFQVPRGRSSSDRSRSSSGSGSLPPTPLSNGRSVPLPPMPDRGGIPRNSLMAGSRSTLTPLRRTIGTGFSGSSSRGVVDPLTGATDPMGDMTGLLRHVTTYGHGPRGGREYDNGEDDLDHEFQLNQDQEHVSMEDTPHNSSIHGDSNAEDSHASNKPFITRNGDKFGKYSIHRAIVRILWRSLNGPWTTFRQVPLVSIDQMYGRFRSLYRWNPNEEEAIREGFENVLKDRYRDTMLGAREASAELARNEGHEIIDIEDSFAILQNFNPRSIHNSDWKGLCMKWSSEKWNKNSKAAKQNRNTVDRTGKTARHTGGSISMAEHRNKLADSTGEQPPFMDVYMKTHLHAEAKKRYFEGDRELRSVDFICGTAEDAAVEYNKAVSEKYGDDHSGDKVDDVDLWRRTGGKKKGRIYGIGAADINFVMTGKHSSQSASCTSNVTDDYAKSQQQVHDLREQLSTLQKVVDEKDDEVDSRIQEAKNDMQRQFDDFLSKLNRSGNPPSR